jgi:tetratricopeptide (TPR) repeat protein
MIDTLNRYLAAADDQGNAYGMLARAYEQTGRRDEARTCYDEALKKNPSIEGDLDITWKIDPEGNVTDTGVDSSKSTIRDDNVSNCIIAIIKRVKFSKSAKGFETKAHYPFNFHPKAGQVGTGGAKPQQQPQPLK